MTRNAVYILLMTGLVACQVAEERLSDERAAQILRAAIAVRDTAVEDSVSVHLERIFTEHGTDVEELQQWIEASREDSERSRDVARRVVDLLDEAKGRDPTAHRGTSQ